MIIPTILYLATITLILLSVYVLFKTKKIYEQGKPLSANVSVGWIIVDILYVIIIVVSAVYGLWRLPLDGVTVRIAGIVLALLGTTIMLAGMLEFRSTHKVLGMETSILITAGIHRWSRNPQFLG